MTEAQKVEFEQRRLWIWLLPALTYACFYCTRYNFTAAHPIIAKQFGWSYSDYGIILTVGLAAYGLAVFLIGPLADKIGGRKAMTIGGIGAAIFNIIFGFTSLFLERPAVQDKITHSLITPAILNFGATSSVVITTMALLWMTNSIFQTCGALSLVKINSAWFELRERGKLSARVGTVIQFGRMMVFWICPTLLLLLPWKYTFWIPAGLLLVMTGITNRVIRDTPEELGLDSPFETPSKSKEEIKLSLILQKVFGNPVMWVIAGMSMCLGVARNSIDHWFSRYFQVMFDIVPEEVIKFAPYKFTVTLMPLAMITGGILGGLLSDRVFNSRRAPIIFFSFLFQLIGLVSLYTYITSPWVAAVAIVFTLAAIQSGHGLLAGTASMDFGGRKAAATAAGFIESMQYLAGSVVGIGMGKWLDAHKVPGHIGIEFTYWPLAPIPTCLLGALISLLIWNAVPKKID